MISTLVLLGSMIGLVVFSVVVWAGLLRLGLRFARVPGTFGRALATSIGVGVVQVALVAALGLAAYRLVLPPPALQGVTIVTLTLALVAPSWLIARAFHAPLRWAALAWLPTLLTPLVCYPVQKFIVVPNIFEAFVINANSMAPTFLGDHARGVCPDCGAPTFGSPARNRRGLAEPVSMICPKFHTHEMSEYDDDSHGPDRVMVSKFLVPRRWDVVMFRVPSDESNIYMKRLIGLPGETVHLDGGAVYINGKKLDPPEALRGIRYVTEFPSYGDIGEVWGSVEKPAVLGENEYFMLGDHSTASLDSRLWDQGAPGHPTYAVPKSLLHGVVTHLYWPADRMRIIR